MSVPSFFLLVDQIGLDRVLLLPARVVAGAVVFGLRLVADTHTHTHTHTHSHTHTRIELDGRVVANNKRLFCQQVRLIGLPGRLMKATDGRHVFLLISLFIFIGRRRRRRLVSVIGRRRRPIKTENTRRSSTHSKTKQNKKQNQRK